MKSTRLLITGSNGQVGGYLSELDWPGFEVFSLDRNTMDLSDGDQVRDVLHQYTPDIVINAAAYTAVDKAESEPDLAERVNADAPRIMAEYLARTGGLMVHYSTDYVFPGDARRPYREDDPTGPIGVYGASKLNGEHGIIGSGADHLILRTSWVYAHRGHNFLLTMLRLGAERDRLTVVDDQIGTPTFAGDLARLTAGMVTEQAQDRDTRRLGIYHLGNSGQASWCQFAQRIFEQAGNRRVQVEPVPTSAYPTVAARPAYSVLSKSRAIKDYAMTIPGWEEGLERCMNLYRSQH